jgi:hypothetical protein
MLKSYALESTGLVGFVDTDGDTVNVNAYSLPSTDAGFFVYVKNACVDLKTSYGKWTIGVQNLNMFGVQEANFGNRFLARPLMDVHKFSSSADLGIGYSNEFGLFKGSLLVTNGGGYKVTEVDKYKKISAQLFAGESALNKKDSGWNAGLVYSMEPVNADDGKTVLGLFGGWAGMGLRAGFEFDTRTATESDPNTTIEDVTDQIFGFYGNYKLPISMPLEVFGQLDLYDPNTDDVADRAGTAEDESKNNETAFILGLKWSPVKGMVVAPNMAITSYEDSNNKEDNTLYRVNFEFKI